MRPAAPNPDQADADHDGVGDACDPSGDEADHIVLFEPFIDASSWQTNQGTWSVPPDALAQVDSNAVVAFAVLTTSTYQRPIVELAIDRIALSASCPGNESGAGSAVIYNPPLGTQEGLVWANGHRDARPALELTSRSGPDATCAADRGATTGAVTLATDATESMHPPSIAIGTICADATFRSVTVFQVDD